jgi:peptidoglycan/LPS O-acetylase OafA/YrhL
MSERATLSHAYRPDIDGLRAVAVLSVLAFHGFPHALPGGFTGVDVFFVISGFLISGILLDKLANGTFSFLDFYQRRIRRIFPALCVVLLAVLVAGYFLLLPDDYSTLGKHVVGGAGFVSNLVLWSEAGYFDTDAALKPLLHLWSLGIEEQFYLVWPLLLWVSWRKRWNTAMVVGGVLVLSLMACLWLTNDHPTASFYSPLTRFWELGVGAMLAIGVRNAAIPRPQDTPAVANAMSLLGAALLACGLAFFDESQPFPGWRALLPTLGACLLIAAGPGALVNRHVLSRRAMVWVGLVSYPLYLWHWPLIAFQNILDVGPTPVGMRVAALALSFVLAAGTYYVIERPIRFRAKSGRTALGLGVAMTLAATLGIGVVAMQGFDGRVPSPVARFAHFKYDPSVDARAGACWLGREQRPDAFASECVDESDARRPLMVVWGDSHAGRFFPGLKKVAGDRFRIAQFNRDSCWPLYFPKGQKGRGYANCIQGNDYVVRRIGELKPAVVVMFAWWKGDSSWIREHVQVTVDKLKQEGVGEVIVMGPAPEWRKALPNNLIDLYQATGTPTPRHTRFGLTDGAFELDGVLKEAIGDNRSVRYFSVLSTLCNDAGCMTWVGNDPNALTSFDYGHLTTSGATFVAKRLAEESDNFGAH